MGRMLQVYQALLQEGNLLDFAAIQTERYRLLVEHPEILQGLRDKIQYLMIDEYQDTNYIQEQIIFLLGGKHENICVVGDDDQGLYRFRGATIRNIVDFKFERKPDMERMRQRLEHYRRQLQIYAYLIEQRTGQKVSKMHLYYTGEENGNPMISFPYTKSAYRRNGSCF